MSALDWSDEPVATYYCDRCGADDASVTLFDGLATLLCARCEERGQRPTSARRVKKRNEDQRSLDLSYDGDVEFE